MNSNIWYLPGPFYQYQEDVKALAAAHIAELEQKINELSSLRDTLKELMDSCQGNDRPDCPILRDLESGCCH